jgi:SpoVK/Ycf46/Vps4 family AAA+-type ATPase
MSIIMGIERAKIRSALSSAGRLAQTGLIRLEPGFEHKLRYTLKLLSDHFVASMLREIEDPADLIRDTVIPARPAELCFDDFTHASESLDIIRPYLRRSVETNRTGVNIFIHGDPGTGKSQLVRLLAEDAGCNLFEVTSEDANRDPISGEGRLQSYRAAQSFLRGQRALILFDETEDVFNDGNGFVGRKSTAQSRKAWMNRMLEENRVPTVWLSNDVSCLDPAFVRRFDFVMELKVPSRQRREAMLHAACGDLVTPDVVSRIASSNELAPAVIARAAAVVKVIRSDLSPSVQGSAVALVIGNTLVAQGHGALPKADVTRLPSYYDPHYVNADADLAAMADGIDRSDSARLCLFGPPGTGKSAFGRWLAQRSDSPLHITRASDLISPYVGVTEKKIAQAFEAAEKDRAILLLDEVDSFLQDRRGAKYGWEVSQVNEMLTQMEAFAGVFIATTNLMGGLDQAALRRFDLKVRFGYLKPEQAWQLFCCQCMDLGLPEPSSALRKSLDTIAVLTPGDFATVARQHRFRPINDAVALFDALAVECAAKEDGCKRTIGFKL